MKDGKIPPKLLNNANSNIKWLCKEKQVVFCNTQKRLTTKCLTVHGKPTTKGYKTFANIITCLNKLCSRKKTTPQPNSEYTITTLTTPQSKEQHTRQITSSSNETTQICNVIAGSAEQIVRENEQTERLPSLRNNQQSILIEGINIDSPAYLSVEDENVTAETRPVMKRVIRSVAVNSNTGKLSSLHSLDKNSLKNLKIFSFHPEETPLVTTQLDMDDNWRDSCGLCFYDKDTGECSISLTPESLKALQRRLELNQLSYNIFATTSTSGKPYIIICQSMKTGNWKRRLYKFMELANDCFQFPVLFSFDLERTVGFLKQHFLNERDLLQVLLQFSSNAYLHRMRLYSSDKKLKKSVDKILDKQQLNQRKISQMTRSSNNSGSYNTWRTKIPHAPTTNNTPLAQNDLNQTLDNFALIDLKSGNFLIGDPSKNYQCGFDGAHFVDLTKDEQSKFSAASNASVINDLILVSDDTLLMNNLKLYNSTKTTKIDNTYSSKARFNLVQGVPGCGKTSFILKNFKIGDLVLYPTKEGATEFSNRLKTSHPELQDDVKNYCRTVHSFLINSTNHLKNGGTYNRFIVDEALMLHAGEILYAVELSQTKEVMMVGDMNQIPYINRVTGHSTQFHDIAKITEISQYLSHSYRCMMTVTCILSKYYSEGMTTSSNVKRELVKHVFDNINTIPGMVKDTKMMVFKKN
ncbi:hypothetical protein J6590_051729 [Homalodisca vitripennis]|nr:hypothetical protein J6590_051729 [Homalodisca vitripennis]